VRDALARLDAVRAVGSTEMLPAVRAALAESRAGAGDRLPIVVLLTDGYIGNEADVLRAIAGDLGGARLYALGVGTAVNRFLLDRAAEIGRGRALFTAPSEDPAEVSTRFASLIDRPVFTDVEVDWGGLSVSDVYPSRLPDLFADRPLTVHGRFAEGGHATVRVRGTMGGRRYERTIDVDLPTNDTPPEARPHATLWARAAVHDRMNRNFLREDPALVEAITDLGLRYRMVTPYTSFVAVEARAQDDGGEAEAASRPTVSPGRALPGDPEIRVPAPRDARAVTIVLPFGETLAAAYEPELGLWTARFLIPADADEGSYPIDVVITHADGHPERLRVWYTVDASAPLVDLTLEGDAHPGGSVRLRATQRTTEADLRQVGWREDSLTPARAQLLSDARRVDARLPDGTVIPLESSGPGAFEAEVPIPADARGRLELEIVVVDLAANVRTQRLVVEVQP
jgi:Ca-activated chloride channel family protein